MNNKKLIRHPRCTKGGDNYLIGRANNNSVDLNRDFPDLDRLLYAEEDEPIVRNNHLMDQIRHLDHPVWSQLLGCRWNFLIYCILSETAASTGNSGRHADDTGTAFCGFC